MGTIGELWGGGGGHTIGTRSVVSQIGWLLITGGGIYAKRHMLIEE